MLVLSRKLGEKICIDGGIELEVLEIRGNRIRLGISAPQDCRVLRSECCLGGPATASDGADVDCQLVGQG